ncbi:STM4504/CBY_0614 family protein [Aurantimonas sp. A3-2-R12]|uniref:STM4504/CBY_0614 family protein n=1 Tax=Aurantimonas sp. A3-2-R12 TaxID=3114362 RepID=UPI002E191E2D|nr:hypothetical protein [Aurantimonas sp. A3-2-R12]
MPVVELYSQRRRRELGTSNDVVQYEILSKQLRRQCSFIISDVFGGFGAPRDQGEYGHLIHALRREFGVACLSVGRNFPGQELESFINETGSNEKSLDAIELSFRLIHLISENTAAEAELRKKCRGAIEEFNHRCRQAGFGYSFENGQMVRVDSQLLHEEAVKPALAVLTDPVFKNADSEFRNAHDHWRRGNNAEVLVDCLKAFESTMKIIAAERNWAVPPRVTASQLVAVMLENDLIPSFYQTQMAGLRSVLESGIATPRNRVGGHGAGSSPADPIPEELVKYVLHLTAATILFLVDAHKARP